MDLPNSGALVLDMLTDIVSLVATNRSRRGEDDGRFLYHIERDEYAREAYELAIRLQAAYVADEAGILPPEPGDAVLAVLARYGIVR